ncbi:MAG: hypothetical protein ACFB0B_22425 [Thermonemataceae bacterium]
MNKKQLLFSIIFWLFVSVGQILAQVKSCTYTYFTNNKRKVATAVCIDKLTNAGEAVAYDLEGKRIGSWSIVGGGLYARVRFTFHANGMVKKAHYSSQPDGGIQWYNSTHTYDDQGKLIGFREDSHDRLQYIKAEKQ